MLNLLIVKTSCLFVSPIICNLAVRRMTLYSTIEITLPTWITVRFAGIHDILDLSVKGIFMGGVRCAVVILEYDISDHLPNCSYLTGFDKELGNPSLMATFFAPVDEAFENLPPPYSIDRMLYDDSPDTITSLQKLMLFHTVPKPMRGEELLDGVQFPTYLGFFSQPPESGGNSSSLVIRQYGNVTTVAGGSTVAKILVSDMGEDHFSAFEFPQGFSQRNNSWNFTSSRCIVGITLAKNTVGVFIV